MAKELYIFGVFQGGVRTPVPSRFAHSMFTLDYLGDIFLRFYIANYFLFGTAYCTTF